MRCEDTVFVLNYSVSTLPVRFLVLGLSVVHLALPSLTRLLCRTLSPP